MTVGILIVLIIAAVIVASFGTGQLWVWAGGADSGWEAFWLGFGTILIAGGVLGFIALIVSVIVTTWAVPL